LEIQILGSGSITPTSKRSYSSIIVKTISENILMDIGPATLYKLCRLGYKLNELNYLLITHFHIDHVADYLPLIHSKAFDPKTGKIKPKGILTVYGPQGLLEFTQNLLENVKPWNKVAENLQCSGYLNLYEVLSGKFKEEKEWIGSTNPVYHSGGVAYRIDSGGKSVAYSGDTVPDENLIKLAEETDLLIHECSFPNEELLIGLHTTASKLGKIAAETKCKRLVLTHLYPICETKIDEMVGRISKDYDGDITVAEDYMRLII
jgi:ribonuclease BN (tRNA processing enzyme)